ncbi:MAG: hypothetical protein WCT05_14050 [Lentisphaeria bacterium]
MPEVRFLAEEKVKVDIQHFQHRVPVSTICSELNIHPNFFYNWQKYRFVCLLYGFSLFLGVGLISGAAEAFHRLPDVDSPHWKNQLLQNRPFFYSLQPGAWSDRFRPLDETVAEGRQLSETSFGSENGCTLLSPSWNFPAPSKKADQLQGVIPNLRYICFREIKIFTPDKQNIAPAAVIFSQSQGGGLQNEGCLTDGDLETGTRSHYPCIDQPQSGFISFHFSEQQLIDTLELHHGQRNAVAWVSVASRFRLQYHNEHGWVDIPAMQIKNNQAASTEHRFTPIRTTAVRILVEDQSDLYDYRVFPFSMENPFLKRLSQEKMVRPGQPFYWWYLGHTGDLFFGFPNQPKVDRDGFQRWQKKNLGFFGFALLEWDNDILKSFLPMGRGFDPKYGFVIEVDGRPLTQAYQRACQTRIVERPFPAAYAVDRKELLQQMENEFRYQNQVLFDDAFTVLSHTTWYHYALEWGARLFMLESTGGTANRQLQFTFARGISRQYQKPWGVYFAYFLGGGYLDYLNAPQGVTENYHSGPHCGISASSHRRQLYLAYLSGAAFFDFEHQDIVPFIRTEQGKYRFSPHGQAMLEVLEFSRQHPERGIPYTPIGLLMDYTHGWTFWNEPGKVFMGFFPMERGDAMSDRFLEAIFPWDKKSFEEGNGYCMTNGPYGDVFDVLIANAPTRPAPGLLQQYQALLLLGDVAIDAKLAQDLQAYVATGGILVLNETQIRNNVFPETFTGLHLLPEYEQGNSSQRVADGHIVEENTPFLYRRAELLTAQALLLGANEDVLLSENRVQDGKVLVSLQKHLLADNQECSPLPAIHNLLAEISNKVYLPFQVEGDIEYLIHQRPDGWWLSLLNNKGVYKSGRKAERIDPKDTASVQIRYRGKADSIKELISKQTIDAQLQAGESCWSMQIPPGEIAILEIQAENENGR